MTLKLNYPDTATFVKVTTGTYSGSKVVESQDDVSVIFVQGTNFNHANFQDVVEADAVCYPDFTSDFIVENANRLEGMYVLMNLYDSTDDASWFKISSVVVNRDHLLGNTIDNIQCNLTKTTAIPGVS